MDKHRTSPSCLFNGVTGDSTALVICEVRTVTKQKPNAKTEFKLYPHFGTNTATTPMQWLYCQGCALTNWAGLRYFLHTGKNVNTAISTARHLLAVKLPSMCIHHDVGSIKV